MSCYGSGNRYTVSFQPDCYRGGNGYAGAHCYCGMEGCLINSSLTDNDIGRTGLLANGLAGQERCIMKRQCTARC